MSTTYTRVASVQVTNIQTINTGTGTPQTAAIGDVILFDRQFNEVADTATVQTSPDVETLYVGLGVGGAMEPSMPIRVRNIRSVRVTPYVSAVPYVVAIGNIIPPALPTEYIVKLIYRDQFSVAPAHSAPHAYAYTSIANATNTQVATGLAAKINKDTYAGVAASVSAAGELVLTGKVITPNAVDYYQRVTFDVATPYGFNADVTQVVSPGSEGQGIGQKVKDLEQTTKYAQRILWPIPTETTKAIVTGTYNLVTIEHYNEHIGDLGNQRKEPLRTIIAFSSDGSKVSAKQAAFMVKLSSVVESADTFVL